MNEVYDSKTNIATALLCSPFMSIVFSVYSPLDPYPGVMDIIIIIICDGDPILVQRSSLKSMS